MDTKKRILIDCDNTVGIAGRPMDDALAILYLLGCTDQAEIVGICTNYGNGTTAECYRATADFLEEIGHTDIPLFAGQEISSSTVADMTGFNIPENNITQEDSEGSAPSPAARFIVDTINANPDQIIYLSIGSTINLYEAMQLQPDLLDKIPQIVIMGGITEPLFIHNKPLSELNLSIEYKASCEILRNGHNISIITGNNCLPVSALPKDEFLDNLCRSGNSSGMYIARKCGYRFYDKQQIYGADSSYCWDAVAAAYILSPEQFTDHHTSCYINEEDMKSGFLHPVVPTDPTANCVLNLPTANDRKSLQQVFYAGWLSVHIETRIVDYSCTGLFLDKLIQPCVLIELSRQEEAHGFLMLQQLKSDGFIESNLDPTGFYRALKKMESEGYLLSRCEGTGKRAKRYYRITDFGRRALLNWQDSLRHYDRHINHIIDMIDTL